MVLRPGRFVLLFLAACGLVFGFMRWSALPRFPLTPPARDLVLQQADLPGSFRLLADETSAIETNPYEDYTEHFRSGYRAQFAGAADSEWRNTRIVSASFVVDLKGAERIYKTYVGSIRHRGQIQSFPQLGQESLFVVASNESSAPVVIIGVVRVRNALITLTVMTDRSVDPALMYGWAQKLVERARPG